MLAALKRLLSRWLRRPAPIPSLVLYELGGGWSIEVAAVVALPSGQVIPVHTLVCPSRTRRWVSVPRIEGYWPEFVSSN